jgi:hypothetical protein
MDLFLADRTGAGIVEFCEGFSKVLPGLRKVRAGISLRELIKVRSPIAGLTVPPQLTGHDSFGGSEACHGADERGRPDGYEGGVDAVLQGGTLPELQARQPALQLEVGIPVVCELRSASRPRLSNGTHRLHSVVVPQIEAMAGNTVRLVEVG